MAVIPAWFECLIGMSGTMQLRPSSRLFDASRLKREFPGLTDPQLHYLDNAATAQMPEVVLSALRRFEVDARANVHEGMHARARAATDAYHQARASIARFLNANTDQEVVVHLRHDLVDQLAGLFLRQPPASPATRSCSRYSSTTATSCLGKSSPNDAVSCCDSCR